MKKTDKMELFEETPVLTAIMKLAVPTIFGQIILVVYNMRDTFFIGLTGSDVKISAVTVCMPAFMFLSAISNLFGVGGSTEVSRSLGRKMPARAGYASAFALWCCVITTLLYSLSAFVFRDIFLDLLGGKDPAVHAASIGYLMVTVVIGGLGTSLNGLFAHLIRSEGNSAIASIGIMAGGILNILLDPLFMFVLLPEGNEVLGAGIATALSNLVATLFFLAVIYIRRKRSALRFRICEGVLDPSIAQRVFSVGLPACMMTLLENVSYRMLDNLIALNGTARQAGVGVAKKVNMLAHCIVRGMTQGVLPLIAYNYAAGNTKRTADTVKLSVTISVSLAMLCTMANLLLARQLIGLFIQSEGASLVYGMRFLRILCLGGPFSACRYSFISFFQAVGQGKKSFVLAIMRKGIFDMPLMQLLKNVSPLYGVVAATPTADFICCMVSIRMFYRFSLILKQDYHSEEKDESLHRFRLIRHE